MCTLVGENDQCAHGQDLVTALLHPDAAAAGALRNNDRGSANLLFWVNGKFWLEK